MNDEIRYKAAAAVALANRAASAGRKEAETAKGKQWQDMPYAEGMKFDPAKLREAVAFYGIAESISPAAAGHGYQRALLLEDMGEWDAAIAAFQAMDGAEAAGDDSLNVRRCRQKQAGTYDELKFMGFSQEQIDAMEGIDADAPPTPEQEALAAAMAGQSIDEMLRMLERATKKPTPTAAAPDDEAAATAQAFVDRLLDRDWAAARAMLDPQASPPGADQLRADFEALFEDEDFPTTANVFDVNTDMPNLGADGVAWVYVNIDSLNAEAVSLVVARRDGRLVVREVEFGRP